MATRCLRTSWSSADDRSPGPRADRLAPCPARTRSRPALSAKPFGVMPPPGNHPISTTAQQALQRTIEHREIFHDKMPHRMRLILNGELAPAMPAPNITGLRVKKETIGEITAAAQVMRE